MGQYLSAINLLSRNDLNLTLSKVYDTRYQGLTTLKIQPGSGSFFVTATESGTLILYDYCSDAIKFQHYLVFDMEFGGVSELLWLTSELLAVGSTRGRIAILALQGNKLVERCKKKAHGDGAARVPVQSMDYCPETKRLVSLGQGLKCISLWSVSNNGNLTSINLLDSPNSYSEPRFVSFLASGSHLLVGVFENSCVQCYAINNIGDDNVPTNTLSLSKTEEIVLGHEDGAPDNRHMGYAIFIKNLNRLAVFNLLDGVDLYDTQFNKTDSIRFQIEACCSQAISSFQDGKILAVPSAKGCINLYRTQGTLPIGRLNLGRQHVIAVHSKSHASRGDVVISTSFIDNRPSKIHVWTNKKIKDKKSRNAVKATGETSTMSPLKMISITIFSVVSIFAIIGGAVAYFYFPMLLTWRDRVRSSTDL